jgi:O-antigen ligase
MYLKALLFFNVLYVVDEIHFKWATGIPVLAPANIIFVLILLAMRNKEDTLEPAALHGSINNQLWWFYGALGLSFLIGEVRTAGSDFVEDLAMLKDGLFYPLNYFLYLRCRQDEKTTRWLIIWVMVIAAVAGVEGLREGLDYGFGKFNPFKRASGPFGDDWHNSNRAGVFYAMFFPMFVALALFLRNRVLWRVAAVGGAIVIAGGAVATYSRQAYFLVILGFALLVLRKNIIVAVVMGAILVSLVSYLPDSALQRVEETQEGGGGKKGHASTADAEVDSSTASRWEIWAGGLQMYKEHPLGVGFHKFHAEIGNYVPAYKNFDAHNFYVLTFAQSGPFGLITWLLLLRALFKLTSFLRKNADPDDPEMRALAYGFTITTLCMAMGGFYGSPNLEGAVMTPYWALCGLLERYTHLKKVKPPAPVGGEPVVEPSIVDRFPLAAHILPGRSKV